MANNIEFSIDDILLSLNAESADKQKNEKNRSMDEIDVLIGTSGKKKQTIGDTAEDVDFAARLDAIFSGKILDEGDCEFESTEELEETKEPKEEYVDVEETKEFKEEYVDVEETKSEEFDSDVEDIDAECSKDEETQGEEIEDESEEETPGAKTRKSVVSQKTKVFSAKTVKAQSSEPSLGIKLDDLDETEIEKAEKTEESDFNLKSRALEKTSLIMELADEGNTDEVFEDDTQIVSNDKSEKLSEHKALAGKTVGIYPIRNENIEHMILSEKVERSNVIESDKYRERFLNKPKQHLERTADYERLHPEGPQDPIERPGIIIKKSKFTNTADLEPIPTIISADAERSNFDKTIVAKGDAYTIEREEEDFISGQMCFGGFGEVEEIEQIDEESAEERLKEKRDQKVASFRLDPSFADLSSDEQIGEDFDFEDGAEELNSADTMGTDFLDDEFDYPSDSGRIKASLDKTSKAAALGGIIQGVMTVVALIVTGIINTAGGNLEIIGGTPLACGIINAVILLIASFFGIGTLMRGVNGLLNRKPNVASGTFIVVVACLLENLVIAFFTSDAYATVSLYTAAGCLALCLSSLSKWIVIIRAKGNLEFITNGTRLYSSEKIPDADDAFEIGRGLLIGEPDVCYNAKISHPKKFIENSFEDDPADAFAEKIVYLVTAVAVLAGLIIAIMESDVVVFFGVFAAVCSIGIPAFSLIASNTALLVVNKEFNKTGAAIVGHRAIKDSTDINAYVLDSTDIFRKGTCSIIGIKTFQSMRIDDAILYAAALVVESGGPLGEVFGNVILGKRELLPPVESLAYEERLGLSAWIHGRRILIGSRDLLINHNVNAPDREVESQYTHDGRKVMYLAIAGKVAAMFVIQYQADKHMRGYLQNLDRAGVSLLVRSTDCNITEEMICHYFDLPLSAVKVLSPVSGDIFQKYRTQERKVTEAGILHNGTIEASLKSIYEARELQDNIGINNIITSVYTGMALLLFVIMVALSGPMGITGTQIVLFQILWGIIAAVIPVIKRKFDK